MAVITINKKQYQGHSLAVINGKVYINGQDVTPESKHVDIQVNGAVKNLNVDYAQRIDITGDVEEVRAASGTVNITGNVKGDVQTTSGNVRCGDTNSVKTTTGNVKCGSVSGNVNTTTGNISR